MHTPLFLYQGLSDADIKDLKESVWYSGTCILEVLDKDS